MKEDILEQLVDDYLQYGGYFTRHNVKFLPRCDHPDFIAKEDSNHSDIDVIGFNPNRRGHGRILVVNCKSWQQGLAVEYWLSALKEKKKIVFGRPAWKAFRELVIPKWTEAFFLEIRETNRIDPIHVCYSRDENPRRSKERRGT
jgi:hypothetical protein